LLCADATIDIARWTWLESFRIFSLFNAALILCLLLLLNPESKVVSSLIVPAQLAKAAAAASLVFVKLSGGEFSSRFPRAEDASLVSSSSSFSRRKSSGASFTSSIKFHINVQPCATYPASPMNPTALAAVASTSAMGMPCGLLTCRTYSVLISRRDFQVAEDLRLRRKFMNKATPESACREASSTHPMGWLALFQSLPNETQSRKHFQPHEQSRAH
jgi:hypothetical protein